MPRSGIVITENTLSKGLKEFSPKLSKYVGAYLQYEESNVQDYMRSNAKWTDRTANARQGLFAKYQGGQSLTFFDISKGGAQTGEGKSWSIVCYHTMPYGIFLEVRWDGKYAIIYPTIVHEGKRIMKGLRGLIGKMK